MNVVLNPDKVWDPNELDQHFDNVAGFSFFFWLCFSILKDMEQKVNALKSFKFILFF